MCPSPADALQNYTGGNLTVTGPKETASVFATYPASYLTLRGGFVDQVGCMCVGDTFASALWGPSPLFGCWMDWGVGSGNHPSPRMPVLDRVGAVVTWAV